jgi:plasmid stabilization system protein ParE
VSAFGLSPEAEEDLWRIWSYLAQEAGLSVANRVESDFFAAFAALARMPGLGHRREDLTSHPVFFLRYINT